MFIAVMSDSHDNKNKLRKAVNLIREKSCEVIIHCGDFTSPDMLYEFSEFSGKVYGVFGNIDRDTLYMKKIADSEVQNIILMGSEGEINIENKKIAFTHYPEIANSLARTDLYDLIFYGHTHRHKINRVNEKTYLINPGDISGRYGKSTFIFYELSTGKMEKIDL